VKLQPSAAAGRVRTVIDKSLAAGTPHFRRPIMALHSRVNRTLPMCPCGGFKGLDSTSASVDAR
jgi:hypothetical protein